MDFKIFFLLFVAVIILVVSLMLYYTEPSSSSSPPVPPQPKPPGAPKIISIIPGDKELTVLIEPPSDSGGSIVTSYEYSTDGGITFASISVPESYSFIITETSDIIPVPLENGTTYQIIIRALNIAGPGANSNQEASTPNSPPPIPKPSEPFITTVSPGDTKLTVFFNPPTSDGGSPIEDYKYSVNGGEYVSVGKNSPFEITGLTNEQVYTIRLVAVNENQITGDPSAGYPASPSIYMILKVTIPNPGNTMLVPLYGTGMNVTVDWGNGTIQTYTSFPIQYSYPAAGNYTIKANGIATIYGFFGGGSYTGVEYITEIVQWGSFALSDMPGACNNAINLISVPKSLPVTVTNLENMFKNANTFNYDIGTWNVGGVTNMTRMFQGAALFNQDLSNWDVSNVENMSYMFQGASEFNSSLNWGEKLKDKATNMNGMFQDALKFDHPSIENWDVSSVENMGDMFFNAKIFNRDISGWNTSSVTAMNGMFANTDLFNANISGWNTGNVENMFFMFSDAKAFNQNIGNWNVENVKYMGSMFQGANNFDQDLSVWTLESILDMDFMFNQNFKYNNLGNPLTWNITTAGPLTMNRVFSNTDFNVDISSWDVSKVESMNGMFQTATSFNQNISGWDVSNVKNMGGMFLNTNSFSQDLSTWNAAALTNVSNIFCNSPMDLRPTTEYPPKVNELAGPPENQNIYC